MTDYPDKLSHERGDAFREAAAIVRGMIVTHHYTMADLPQFLEDHAAANDILLAERQKATN